MPGTGKREGWGKEKNMYRSGQLLGKTSLAEIREERLQICGETGNVLLEGNSR